MRRPLSLSPVFRGLREQLLTRASRNPVCEDCGEEYDPAHHALHKNQLCPRPQRPAPTTNSRTA